MRDIDVALARDWYDRGILTQGGYLWLVAESLATSGLCNVETLIEVSGLTRSQIKGCRERYPALFAPYNLSDKRLY